MKIEGRFTVQGLKLYPAGVTVSLANEDGSALEIAGATVDLFLRKGKVDVALSLGQTVRLTIDDEVTS